MTIKEDKSIKKKNAPDKVVQLPSVKQDSSIKLDEMDRLKLNTLVLEHQLLLKDIAAIKKEFEYKNKESQDKVIHIQNNVHNLIDKYDVPIGWGFDLKNFTFIPENQMPDNK